MTDSQEVYFSWEFQGAADEWEAARQDLARFGERATPQEIRRAAKALARLNRIAASLDSEATP